MIDCIVYLKHLRDLIVAGKIDPCAHVYGKEHPKRAAVVCKHIKALEQAISELDGENGFFRLTKKGCCYVAAMQFGLLVRDKGGCVTEDSEEKFERFWEQLVQDGVVEDEA